MANLETLELTIQANAESATQGIGDLITSLSRLSTAIVKPYSDVRDFNAALKEMKTLSAGIKFSGAADAVKKVTKQFDLANNNGRGATSPQWALDAQKKADERLAAEANRTGKTYYDKYPESREIQKYQVAAMKAYREEQSALKSLKTETQGVTTARKESTSAISQEINQTQELKKSTTNAIAAQRQFGRATHEAVSGQSAESVNALDKVKQGFNKFTDGIEKMFSRIKRIATTMLIRAAIRGLIKSMREGVQNVYGWSKVIGGDFAEAMNKAKASAQTMKNALGASLSGVISALIPLFRSLSSAIITAANWINQFIALLSGKSSWTKAVETATEVTDDLADSAGGAGSAAKDMLAAFDELNVIQSSGGGGGGGGNTLEEQYGGLFEDITEFEKKIKDITTFIKDNIDTIKTVVATIGTTILAWKLGNSFAEALPVLSTIFGYIATAGAIAVTIELTWLFANQYMNTGKDGWLFAEGLTTALGATAAWAIANKLIGGNAGYYAAAITLEFSAITGIIANVGHTDVDALSATSLKQNIIDSLKAGVGLGIGLVASGVGIGWSLVAAGAATLLVFGATIGLKLLTQKNHIEWGDMNLTQEQINEYAKENMFTAEANVLIDKLNTVLDQKLNLEQSVREKLSEINTDLNILTLGIDKNETLTSIANVISGADGTGGLVKDISDLCDVNVSMLKINFGNMKAYDGQGNEISSDAILTGISGWDKIKDQMKTDGAELTRMLFKGATEQLTPEEQAYTNELLEKVTDSARKIANAQAFADTAVDFRNAAIEAMNKNSVQGVIDAFENYSSGNEETIRQGWLKTAQSYVALASIEDNEEIKKEYIRIANDIIDGLDQTVAEELKKENQPGIDLIAEWLKNTVTISDLSGIDYWIGVLQEQGFSAETFGLALKQLMMNNGVDKTVIEAMNLVGVTGWDLLTDEIKKKFLSSVKITPETVAELKKVGVTASEIFGVTDWASFSKAEKFKFLDAIKDAFGADEAIEAAKNAGIKIGELISSGMGDADPKIRKEAQEWRAILQGEVGKDVKAPNINGDKSKITNAGKEAYGWFTDKFKTAVKAKVETTKSNINKVKAAIDGAVKQARQVNVNVDGEIANSFVKTLGDKIKNIVQEKLNKVTVKVKTEIKAPNGATAVYASGGSVPTGQMFIAREAGPELVGQIGNHTAVMNNEQIVESVSNGVYAANAEQNALLRQQNQILYSILAKTGNGIPGASSALGRVVSQSLDMYSTMTGGR